MKYLLTILVALTVLSGCKKKQENYLYQFSISNATGNELNAVNGQTGQTYKLNPGNTTILSNKPIETFNIVPVVASAKKYALEPLGEHSYGAYSYDNDIEYRFSGTASKAKISYTTNLGDRAYADKVGLPYWIAYKDFTIKNCGMDTENLEDIGNVTVEIFFKGKLIKDATAPKRAAASSNINGGAF